MRPESEAPKKNVRRGLYIKCPSEKSAELEQVKKLLRIFDGTTPVYVYFIEDSKLTCAPRSLWISPNSVLIGELKRFLGEGNIKLVE